MKAAISNTILLILTTGWLFCGSCHRAPLLFESLPPSKTGISFTNKVIEDDVHNVLEYMNIYTGAGVAAGDINNDGLVDLYFSGNQNSGKLYLNIGNFQFEDITARAGVTTNRWCTGVSMADVNNDGWLDIYINVSGSPKFGDMHNLLFINSGDGTFKETAAKYGVAETRQTMNASFFDYDRDGDLDLFLITNPADGMMTTVNTMYDQQDGEEAKGPDILYRNNGDETFTDVSKEAGIVSGGYSLGAAISDVNGDGWPDIYVSNDFLSNDILYINNRSGSFSDETSRWLKHTSFASMGNDVADINNDGLPDIYTLDMLPEDNFRKKMIIPSASYDRFQLSIDKGYEPQYTRNTLQLNNGNGSFSDVAFLSGVSSSDWSWSALLADYDNDGDKDLMVTNGFFRDLGNLDYINYQARLNNPMGRQDAKRIVKLEAIKKIENAPLQNYLFENNGGLRFTKRTDNWGFKEKGFSNGACYADLDNDGDLDLVLSCFNSTARVYKNNSDAITHHGYLNIYLNDSRGNRNGIGAKVWVFANGKMQFQELNPYRGYESTMEPSLHFGLDKSQTADSIKIEWPDGKIQIERAVRANQRLTIHAKRADDLRENSPEPDKQKIFTDVTGKQGLTYVHQETGFVDFKVQPLLPHMFSRNGPGIAVGDVNGDGLEDFFVGGTAAAPGTFFFQNGDGHFIDRILPNAGLSDDMGVLFFDADNDEDLDLYVVGGGSEEKAGDSAYQDRFFQNDGRGNFFLRPSALPTLTASGSCVVASDYDHDGDLDLFVGGRVVPGRYPLQPASHLLRNDSPADHSRAIFKDVTGEFCPSLSNIGMVASALWSDYDNDGWSDLVVVGEFMPLTIIKNEQGKKFGAPLIIENTRGWWNSITGGDFDNDGDIDYIAGNLGLNTRHKASVKEPLCIYAKDFDKNGLIDPLMCYYVDGKNYLFPTRDEMIRQIAAMRIRFPTYKDYAQATFEESFTNDELRDAYVVKSECFETSYFSNNGNGKFRRTALPVEAQYAPVFGLVAGDYNNDGKLDCLVAGNSYATDPSTGRYDAMTGLLLNGDGRGGFAVNRSAVTGFTADGDVKGLAQLVTADKAKLVLVGNNSGAIGAYRMASAGQQYVKVGNSNAYALVQRRDGSKYKQEFYFGSNYLSCSSRMLEIGRDVSRVTIFDYSGKSRELEFAPR